MMENKTKIDLKNKSVFITGVAGFIDVYKRQEYILAGSNVDDYESLQYFQRQLGESGILDALVQKGVQENDTILIGEYQFDYIF